MTGHKYLHQTMGVALVVGATMMAVGAVEHAQANGNYPAGPGWNYEATSRPSIPTRQTRDWTIYGPPGQQETVEIDSNATTAEMLAIQRDVRRRHGWR